MNTMKKFITLAFCAALACTGLRAQSWNGNFKITVENAQNKTPFQMIVTQNDNQSAMQIADEGDRPSIRIIYDWKANTMTTLTEKNGSNFGMVSNIPDIENSMKKDDDQAKITVTDETKVIDGYDCKKIIAESDEAVSEMWMTEATGLTYQNSLGLITRGRGPASGYARNLKNYEELKGISLLTTITSKKKSSDVTTVKITDLKKGAVDEKVFDTSGFQLMRMPSMKSVK